MPKLGMRKFSVLILALLTWTVAVAAAAPPSDQLLPATTKGYVSVPDMERMLAAWDATGVGSLFKDPSMAAFAKDLERQLNERFGLTGVRMGISWDDLRSICAGEVSVSFVATDDPKQRHSIVALADAAGRDEAVGDLLKRIDESMQSRGAKRRQENWNGTTATIYTVPVQQGGMTTFEAVMLQHQDVFVAADHPSTARDVLTRLQGKSTNPDLSRVLAFAECMKRCDEEANGLAPHARWFIEPLGYAELARDAAGGRRRRRTDYIDALRNQGFDAVQGMGGYVNFHEGPRDILQRCFIYAPPVPGADAHRFKLAARVLNFHKIEDLAVSSWVPANVSSHINATWGIQDAYQYLGTLVDEVAGDEGFWEDLKKSILVDPSGPQIDLDKEVVAHLGTRVTVITDYTQPITTSSERFLVAIEVKDAAAMKKSIAKLFKDDPQANRIQVDDAHEIWELVEQSDETPALDIEGGSDFDLGIEENYEEDEAEVNPLLANAAFSVLKLADMGYLVVSSHAEFISEMIKRPEASPSLVGAADLEAIRKSLAEIGSDQSSAEVFSRTADQMRISYDLIKQGKMPESQSLWGRVLNQFMSGGETSTVREQRLDGENLPDFAQVEQHLGPIGVYLKPDPNGWFLGGVGLPPAKTAQAAVESVDDEAEVVADDEAAEVETASKDDGVTDN